MTLRPGRRIVPASARVAAPAGTGGPGRRDRAAWLAHLLPAGPAMTEAASGVPGAGEQRKRWGCSPRTLPRRTSPTAKCCEGGRRKPRLGARAGYNAFHVFTSQQLGGCGRGLPGACSGIDRYSFEGHDRPGAAVFTSAYPEPRPSPAPACRAPGPLFMPWHPFHAMTDAFICRNKLCNTAVHHQRRSHAPYAPRAPVAIRHRACQVGARALRVPELRLQLPRPPRGGPDRHAAAPLPVLRLPVHGRRRQDARVPAPGRGAQRAAIPLRWPGRPGRHKAPTRARIPNRISSRAPEAV